MANQPTMEDNWTDFVWANVDGTSFYGTAGINNKYFIPLKFWNIIGNNSFTMKIIGKGKDGGGDDYNKISKGVHLDGNKYKLVIDGDNQNSFLQVGNNFSTKDQDNDTRSSNCAISYHSPWWMSNCHSGTPLGGNRGKPNSIYFDGSRKYYNHTFIYIK